jgi:hypothetical protein
MGYFLEDRLLKHGKESVSEEFLFKHKGKQCFQNHGIMKEYSVCNEHQVA